MSVLIKGMEMPKSCDDCFLPLQYCPYAMKPDGSCPLAPVPPHGRLIESKAFLKVAHETDDFSLDELAHLAVLVAATPTIIQAEEGE